MTVARFFRVALAGAFLAGAAFAAHADNQSSGNAGVDARKAVMKEIGGNLKKIKDSVQGAPDAVLVASAAAGIAASAAEIRYVFGDEIHVANANGVKTTATADIWSKWHDFSGNADSLEASAVALAGIAAGGDAEAMKAGFGEVAKNCGACHKAFREKKN